MFCLFLLGCFAAVYATAYVYVYAQPTKIQKKTEIRNLQLVIWSSFTVTTKVYRGVGREEGEVLKGSKKGSSLAKAS